MINSGTAAMSPEACVYTINPSLTVLGSQAALIGFQQRPVLVTSANQEKTSLAIH